MRCDRRRKLGNPGRKIIEMPGLSCVCTVTEVVNFSRFSPIVESVSQNAGRTQIVAVAFQGKNICLKPLLSATEGRRKKTSSRQDTSRMVCTFENLLLATMILRSLGSP